MNKMLKQCERTIKNTIFYIRNERFRNMMELRRAQKGFNLDATFSPDSA